MINYHNKKFKAIANSNNGEVGEETLFHYYQEGQKLWGTYKGGDIKDGHLLGKVHDDGSLEFFYHHLNHNGHLMAGQCFSTPQKDKNGMLILDEKWEWFNNDKSSGTSRLQEVL